MPRGNTPQAVANHLTQLDVIDEAINDVIGMTAFGTGNVEQPIAASAIQTLQRAAEERIRPYPVPEQIPYEVHEIPTDNEPGRQVRRRLYDMPYDPYTTMYGHRNEKIFPKSRVLDEDGELIGISCENGEGKLLGFKVVYFDQGNSDGVYIDMNRNEAEKLFKFLKSRFEPEVKNDGTSRG